MSAETLALIERLRPTAEIVAAFDAEVAEAERICSERKAVGIKWRRHGRWLEDVDDIIKAAESGPQLTLAEIGRHEARRAAA
jgi:hypothetical protein